VIPTTVAAADLNGYDVCDIQCFYCCHIFRVDEQFVMCETCEGFVSCPTCWEKTEEEGQQYGIPDLEEVKDKRLRRDARRRHKLWPQLAQHKFSMQHADWTDLDSGDFNTYTYRQLAALREAGLTGEVGHKRKEPAAAASPPATPARRTMSAPHSAPPPAAAAAAAVSSTKLQQTTARVAPASAPHSNTTARSLFVRSQASRTIPAASSQPSRKSAPASSGAVNQRRQIEEKEEEDEDDDEEEERSSAAQTTRESTPSVTAAAASTLLCPPPDAALLKLYTSRPLKYSSAIEVRASAHLPPLLGQPCQLGVFATRDIPKDSPICYYASHREFKKQVKQEESSHARRLAETDFVLDGRPTARLFTRYIAHDRAGIAQVLQMPAAAFLAQAGTDKAKLLAQLAVGCMINSPAGRPGDRPTKPNVKVAHGRIPDGAGLPLGALPFLVAKFNIKIGEELLCCYHNPEEKGEKKWQATLSD